MNFSPPEVSKVLTVPNPALRLSLSWKLGSVIEQLPVLIKAADLIPKGREQNRALKSRVSPEAPDKIKKNVTNF